MRKRLFSILLAIAMVVGMMPGTAYALDKVEIEYNSHVYSDMSLQYLLVCLNYLVLPIAYLINFQTKLQ
jgi:hypothetical protein